MLFKAEIALKKSTMRAMRPTGQNANSQKCMSTLQK